MEKYRFDDAYETVHEYDPDANAYIFCGKYHTYGITSELGEAEKIGLLLEPIDFEIN